MALKKSFLMFDQDEHGQKAAREVAKVLPPGKAKIAKLPLKDASECLVQGEAQAIIQAIWQAQPYKPGGILTVADVKRDALKQTPMGLSYPWEDISLETYGRHPGNLIAIGGGTGCGKTTVISDMVAHDVYTLGIPTCVFHSEQVPKETAQRVAGMIRGQILHLPDSDPKALSEALEELAEKGNLYLYDDSEAFTWEAIRDNARYVHYAFGVKCFYLDNLTALASHAEDERRFLDSLMKDIADFAKDTGTIWHIVSHLTTPDKAPHEEGGRVMARHFRGSRAIQQWCHFMFGLERNQQAEDEDERKTMKVRCLKDRLTGRANGLLWPLWYEDSKGKYVEDTTGELFGSTEVDEDIGVFA